MPDFSLYLIKYISKSMSKQGLSIFSFPGRLCPVSCRYLFLLMVFFTAFLPFALAGWQKVYTDGLGTEHVLPGHIIFKLTTEAVIKTGSQDALPETVQSVLGNEKAVVLARVFPHHKPPAEKYHPSGRPFSDLSRIYEVIINNTDRKEEMMFAIAGTGLVEYVQPRYVPQLFTGDEDTDAHFPNDTLLWDQYFLESVSAFQAWAVWKGDTNTVIGIVDTGIDLHHPDIVDAIKYNYDDPINGEDSDGDGYIDNFYGWDLGEGNNDPTFNRNAHGLHVSGIAAATTDNITGIAGAGYKSKFLPVKICDEFGRLIKAYEGIVYAADQGVSVINCSWGSHFNPGPFGQDIIDYAVLNRDVLVIGAAGNANTADIFFPASLERVLSVAAIDSFDIKTHFSSYGPFVDVTAPGAGVLSTWRNNSYTKSSGTSMAAPIVAGAAAITRSFYPELDALQVKALLKMTSDPIDDLAGNEDYAEQLGFGRLNMLRALTETTHPYITVSEELWNVGEITSIRPGEYFSLFMEFTNRLAPAEGVYAIMSCDSPYLFIANDSIHLGNMNTHDILDNEDNPFIINTSPDLPANHEVLVTIRFFDHDKRMIGRKSIFITLNIDYLNIKAGRIATTVSARGAIGFNYPDLNQGFGLRYNKGYTLIRCAGLILGDNTHSVVDNVYGSEADSYSETLKPVQSPVKVTDHPKAPLVVNGRVHDQPENGSPPLDVSIDYRLYFWDDDPAEDFFIIRYSIVNQSSAIYKNLFAGFFADWVLRDVKQHRARINTTARLAYSYAETGGAQYAGIQLLSHGGMRHYAFDNQGAHGSMQIVDGFTDFKKYTALSSNRFEAGFYANENNISSLLSTGPHHLSPHDTLEVAFAIHLADHFDDMLENTAKSQTRYHQLLDFETGIPGHATTACSDLFRVYPNPFTDHLVVELCPQLHGEYKVSLYDLHGRRLYEKVIDTTIDGGHFQIIELNEIYTGVYILNIQGVSVNESKRVIGFER